MSKIEQLVHDDNSFGHGRSNSDGLGLKFEVTPAGAATEIRIADKFQGWPGVVHGGIVATCLDEAMGHAVTGKMRSYSMSVELEIFYLAPTMTNEEIVVTGKVAHVDGRKINTVSELRRKSDNALLAHGKALFILVKGEEEKLHGTA